MGRYDHQTCRKNDHDHFCRNPRSHFESYGVTIGRSFPLTQDAAPSFLAQVLSFVVVQNGLLFFLLLLVRHWSVPRSGRVQTPNVYLTLKDMYPRSHDGTSRRGTRSAPFAEKPSHLAKAPSVSREELFPSSLEGIPLMFSSRYT